MEYEEWFKGNGFKYQWTMENHQPSWWEKRISEHVVAKLYDVGGTWECGIKQSLPDNSTKLVGHAWGRSPQEAWEKAYAQYGSASKFKKVPVDLIRQLKMDIRAVCDGMLDDLIQKLDEIPEEY